MSVETTMRRSYQSHHPPAWLLCAARGRAAALHRSAVPVDRARSHWLHRRPRARAPITATSRLCWPGSFNNLAASRGYRLLQLAPFLLALTFPRAVALLTGMTNNRRQLIMIWAGRVGFALFALGPHPRPLHQRQFRGGICERHHRRSARRRRGILRQRLCHRDAALPCRGRAARRALPRARQPRSAPRASDSRRVPPLRLLRRGAAHRDGALLRARPWPGRTPTSTVTLFGLALWFIGLGVVFLRQTTSRRVPADSRPSRRVRAPQRVGGHREEVEGSRYTAALEEWSTNAGRRSARA